MHEIRRIGKFYATSLKERCPSSPRIETEKSPRPKTTIAALIAIAGMKPENSKIPES